MNTFISNLIGEDYKKWQSGDNILINAGTGSGKSTFAIQTLGKYAEAIFKRVLYLTNRDPLKGQVTNGVFQCSLNNHVDIMNYQALETMLRYNVPVGDYDYIVIDECHYFTNDSSFNSYTDLSFEYIMSQNAVRIWMSASAKKFFGFLKKNNNIPDKNIYKVEKDYCYITSIYFYSLKDREELIDTILNTEPESKILVFENEVSTFKALHDKYKDIASFYCSKNASKDLQRCCKVKGELVNPIKDGKLTSRLTVTTSVLDNGIDIKDKSLKYVFINTYDTDEIIQEIGRKRPLDDNDSMSVYIKNYGKQQLKKVYDDIGKETELGRKFRQESEEFVKEYNNDKDLIKHPIFNATLGKGIFLNNMLYMRLRIMRIYLEDMMRIGFKNTVMQELGKGVKNVKVYMTDPEEIALGKLKRYLSYKEHRPLYDKEKKEIIQRFKTIGLCTKNVSRETLNSVIDDMLSDYPYRFYDADECGRPYRDTVRATEDGKTNDNLYKRYWVLR